MLIEVMNSSTPLAQALSLYACHHLLKQGSPQEVGLRNLFFTDFAVHHLHLLINSLNLPYMPLMVILINTVHP